MKISLALVVHGFGKVIFSDYYDVIYEWDAEAAKIEGMLQLANRLKREAMALNRIHKAKENSNEVRDPDATSS